VYAEPLTETLAQVLGRLGCERAWVVWGEGGLDEVTTAGRTRVAEIADGAVRGFDLDPGTFGLPRCRTADLRGGDAAENAKILRDVLSGQEGPRRDVVLANAAAALVVAGRARDVKQGVDRAAASIDRGAALEKLESLIQFTA
jgi:anthranilate phosphoribosyltransferase